MTKPIETADAGPASFSTDQSKNLKPTVRNLTVGAAKKLEDGCTGKRTPDQAARF